MLSLSAFPSESKMDSLIRVSNERVAGVKKDSQLLEKTKQNMDTTFQLANDCKNILSKEVDMYGWKKMIQINAELFLPIAIFIILFLIWLKGRKI